MRTAHRTVNGRGTDEFTVQKSRFIGVADRVETEEDCRALIAACKKEYPQAKHYCSAWILDDQGIRKRADDDREPQGTAGMPMLAVLEHRGLSRVCCVAIRYFGGILLGTGGLARAYTQTAVLALDAAGIVTREPAVEMKVRLSYPHWGAVQYRLETENKPVAEVQYSDQVSFTLYTEAEELAYWEQTLAALTGGGAEIMTGKEVWLSKPWKGDTDE